MKAWLLRAALLLALVGCEEEPQTIVNPPAAEPLAAIDLPSLERTVALVRRLPLTHTIEAQALSDEDFRARVEASSRLTKRAGEARDAFIGTVGVGSVERSPGDSERRMLEEGVAGLYDHHTGR